jgi:hypothetical protein
MILGLGPSPNFQPVLFQGVRAFFCRLALKGQGLKTQPVVARQWVVGRGYRL